MITAQAESQLEELIKLHGYRTVRRHLAKLLFGTAGWSDWQSLEAAVRQAKNRLERKGAQ